MRIPLVLLTSLLLSGGLHAQTVAESIFFIKEDGLSYLNYHTTRSSHESYNLFLNKDDPLKNFDYIYPNQFEIDTQSDPQKNIIRFPQGNYATMRPGTFEDKVTIQEDGTWHFQSWEEERDGGKRPDGHYGIWNIPDNFANYAYAWVLPDEFEFVDFSCNRGNPDDWVQRRNTLAWFGSDVNDIVFTIRYRQRSAETLKILRDVLPEDPNVEIKADVEGVRVIFSDDSLFSPTDAELTDEGKLLLKTIADNTTTEQRLIIEGHTDNMSVPEVINDRYQSNWELSASRALAIIRHFQELEVDGSRLESHAFAEFRPAASNETEEGRSRNRRVEILIKEARRNGQSPR